MKKSLLFCISVVSVLFMLSSCEFGLDPLPNEFNQEFLYGKWQSGTVFEKYAQDGTGYTWDTADDVSEDEAQLFTWTLSYDDLTQVHKMTVGGDVPRVYKVNNLTETVLEYTDEAANPAKNYIFTKVD